MKKRTNKVELTSFGNHQTRIWSLDFMLRSLHFLLFTPFPNRLPTPKTLIFPKNLVFPNHHPATTYKNHPTYVELNRAQNFFPRFPLWTLALGLWTKLISSHQDTLILSLQPEGGSAIFATTICNR